MLDLEKHLKELMEKETEAKLKYRKAQQELEALTAQKLQVIETCCRVDVGRCFEVYPGAYACVTGIVSDGRDVEEAFAYRRPALMVYTSRQELSPIAEGTVYATNFPENYDIKTSVREPYKEITFQEFAEKLDEAWNDWGERYGK